MAAIRSTSSPLNSPSGTGAESPTTVRPLDMDDDDIQEPKSLSGHSPTAATTNAGEENAPSKPPRPLNPQQEAENTLKEAFPTIDVAVVKAVLIASGGRVEPAFNALLGMSDPDAVVEAPPPPQPPRPSAIRTGSTPQSQLEADEQYARQLAEHYDTSRSYGPRSSSRGTANAQRGQNLKPNELHDENYSFLDDDLPAIKENLRKGFLETQTKVNGWITNLKKRIDGDDLDNADEGHSGQAYSSQYAQSGSRRSGDVGRRSGDYNRYDADPQVLGDDFAGIQLNDDGSQARRSTRPLANPDLFKPTPTLPKSADGRKVAFQTNRSEEDLYRSSPKLSTKEVAPSKQSKWQPLSTVEPSPIGDADNDPFSLGDSEDEKETKDRVGGKEIKMEDTDRLKKAAADANTTEPARKLELAETSGTKDKVAEELTGNS